MLPIIYAHRTPTAVMISEHRDGEIIARIVRLFGLSSFRGSSSRGGARALMEGVRLVRSGIDIGVTPDGPRGPLHSYAPGAAVLAWRAAIKVCPIRAHADRAWRLKSWDAFLIPKPFARVRIAYGDPVEVIASDSREAATATEALKARMDETGIRAASRKPPHSVTR
jgi:lysophospholipid acyltransferase (LPLAT)-like uncharacterized protein